MLNTETKATLKALKEERDQLNLTPPTDYLDTHFAWLQLEEKWDELLLNVRNIAHDSSNDHDGIEEVIESLSSDLKEGYNDIRRIIH